MKINFNTLLLIIIAALAGWFVFKSMKPKQEAEQAVKQPTNAGNNILPATPPVSVGIPEKSDPIIQYLPWESKPRPVIKSSYSGTIRRITSGTTIRNTQ